MNYRRVAMFMAAFLIAVTLLWYYPANYLYVGAGFYIGQACLATNPLKEDLRSLFLGFIFGAILWPVGACIALESR